MYIAELKENHHSEYSQLAECEGTVFDNLKWLRLFKDRVKIFGIYNDDHRIIGGFHVFYIPVLGFYVLRNPPFTPHIGPFFINPSTNFTARLNFQRVLGHQLADFFSSRKFILVFLAFSKQWTDGLPFFWKRFHVSPNYTYVVSLDKPIEQILADMSGDRRNDIRKAISDGLKVDAVEDYSILRELIIKTFQRNRKAVSLAQIDNILFSFANKSNSYARVAFSDGIAVAGCFCIHDRETAYYLLSGYDHKHKHHGAGALALWEAIKHAKELHLKFFDFEGSMIRPIEKYIRGFGGTLSPYYRVSRAWFGLEAVFKLKFPNYF